MGMTRARALAVAFAASFLGLGIAAAAPATSPVVGLVHHRSDPIPDAIVLVYNLGNATLSRSRTSDDGRFAFAAVAPGVYDVVAYKPGFLPSLIQLWHQATGETRTPLAIDLQPRGPGMPSISRNDDVWSLRSRLPADVLREIGWSDSDFHQPAAPLKSVRLDHLFGGEMNSSTGVAGNGGSMTRGGVQFRGGLPNGWQYRLSGDYATVSGATATFADASQGSSTGIALDVTPSSSQSIRAHAMRQALDFADGLPGARLATESISWSQGDEGGGDSESSVTARYWSEENLNRGSLALFATSSNDSQISGRFSQRFGADRSLAVAVTLRRREGAFSSDQTPVRRSMTDGDLSVSGRSAVAGPLSLEAGLVSRIRAGDARMAPRALAQYELAPGATIFVSGLYRVTGSDVAGDAALPRLTTIDDDLGPASRYAIGAGFQTGDGSGNVARIQASERRVDEVARVFFEGDLLADVDSVYVFDGNRVREVTGHFSQRWAEFNTALEARYGTIDGEVNPRVTEVSGVRDDAGHFWSARATLELRPTKTGIAVLVRSVRQNIGSPTGELANGADNLRLSVSQNLSVLGVAPFGSALRVLISYEAARRQRVDAEASAQVEDVHRVMGGLALAF
jgi:Carboxypeptidase regulatory-like domain